MELSAIPQSFFALAKGKTESCDDRKPFGSETTANCLLLGLRHDISSGRNVGGNSLSALFPLRQQAVLRGERCRALERTNDASCRSCNLV